MTVSNAPTIVQPEIDMDEELRELDLPYESTDDPNTKTHVVRPYENGHIFKPGMTAKDIVNIARHLGLEVVALCGHRWVPKHNPDVYPACEACIKLAGDLYSNPHGLD